jgi:hypothetical protein
MISISISVDQQWLLLFHTWIDPPDVTDLRAIFFKRSTCIGTATIKSSRSTMVRENEA